MTELEKLLAVHEIHGLKARYFRYVDTKDWEGLRSLFTADALVHYPEARDEPDPIEVVIPFVIEALHGAVTVHQGHMPEIDILSDDLARGIWAMEDVLYWVDREGGLPGETQHGFGHYHERYMRKGGKWLIDRLTLTRLRLVRSPAARRISLGAAGADRG